jgi:hypothetical protein
MKAEDRVLAGPAVFICRDCAGICVSVFSRRDARWRDEKIEDLETLRDKRADEAVLAPKT